MANDQWITIKIKKNFNDDNKIFIQVGECAPLPLQSQFSKAVGLQFDQNGDSIELLCENGMVPPPNGRWKADQTYILVYPEEDPKQTELINKAKEKIPKLKFRIAITDNNYAVTIINKSLFATVAHGKHSELKKGDELSVRLLGQAYKQIKTVVSFISSQFDVVLLKPTEEIEIPPNQMGQFQIPYDGQLYINLGFSCYEQLETPLSVAVGMISSTSFDQYMHIRGSTASCFGESGGPVCDFYSGALIGMITGNQIYHLESGAGSVGELGNSGLKCHIIPVECLMALEAVASQFT